MNKIKRQIKRVFRKDPKKTSVKEEVKITISEKGRKPKLRKQLSGTTTIVCDIGSSTTRLGLANSKLPSLEMTSYVGRRQAAGQLPLRMEHGIKNFFVGEEAKRLRRVLVTWKPIKNGQITDLDALSFMLDTGFHGIGALSRTNEDLSGHNLLFAFRPSERKRTKERLFQTLMETYAPDGCYFTFQQPLVLLATGQSTGLVLDSGEGITHAVPVYEGYAMHEAIQTAHLGGEDVTEGLVRYIAQQGFRVQSVGDKDLVDQMKQKLAFVSSTPNRPPGNVVAKSFKMPDGKNIVLQNERYLCTEPLFSPNLIGHAGLGMATAVNAALQQCPLYVQRQLAENIIPCGGNSRLTGFDARLDEEVKRNYAGYPVVRCPAASTRQTVCWSGGAALANNPAFLDMLVTQAEYEEDGIKAFRRKCF